MKTYTITTLKKENILLLLALQQENLKRNLDAETIESQGFVSFVYSPDDIKGMMHDEPQIIAVDGDEIVGYALTASLEYAQTVDLLRPLVEKSKTLIYNDTSLLPRSALSDSHATIRNDGLTYYIMGQVCVKAGYRGIGIFDALYHGHKEYLSAKYDGVITEIATENKRSLAAHRRVGFTTIYKYYDEFSQKDWEIVLWMFNDG